MFQFVDRISEQIRLKKALRSDKASFVVVYGRRRCADTRPAAFFGICFFFLGKNLPESSSLFDR
jgi:hypothetical protein